MNLRQSRIVNDAKKELPPNRKMVKATQVEYEARIKTVASLSMQGFGRPDIIEYALNNWGIGGAATDLIIAKATKRIIESTSKDINKNIAVVVANYWKQYRIAEKANNGLLCMMALKEISKIYGIDRQVVEHRHFNAEEIDRIDTSIIDAELSEDE